MSSGQPSVANGQSADENHVSSTSGSRVARAEPHSAHASGSVSAQVTCPSGQYQIGSWWPHHSWRDTFQGRIAFSQSSATLLCTGGWNVTRPDSIASIGGRGHRLHLAPPLQRDERLDARAGALAVADGVPVALALLERPCPAQPLDDVVGGLLLGEADELRRDIARHAAVEADHGRLGQPVVAPDLEVDRVVAGVIFRAPVPKSGSTRSSAIIGTRRSTTGTITCLPIRCV